MPGKTEDLADCLLSRVQVAFPDALLVHRLDRDTSGVMVFGMTVHAQRHLSMQFERRLVKKTYIARVSGKVAEKSGEIALPLIVDWPNRPLQKVCYETGRSAFTEWVRLKVGYGESRPVADNASADGRAEKAHLLHQETRAPGGPTPNARAKAAGAHVRRRGAVHPEPPPGGSPARVADDRGGPAALAAAAGGSARCARRCRTCAGNPCP